MLNMREPFPGNPPPITSRPEGLLSMLGLQTNGRYPQHLEMGNLGAEIDLLRWYLESQATFKTGTMNFVAGSFQTSTNLTVPAGEHWLVLQYNALCTSVSVDTKTGFLCRANSSAGTIVALGPKCDCVVNERYLLTQGDWALGYLARPSVQLGVYGLIGGTVSLDYTLRYVRLQT